MSLCKIRCRAWYFIVTDHIDYTQQHKTKQIDYSCSGPLYGKTTALIILTNIINILYIRLRKIAPRCGISWELYKWQIRGHLLCGSKWRSHFLFIYAATFNFSYLQCVRLFSVVHGNFHCNSGFHMISKHQMECFVMWVSLKKKNFLISSTVFRSFLMVCIFWQCLY